jgi:hypothetical protein
MPLCAAITIIIIIITTNTIIIITTTIIIDHHLDGFVDDGVDGRARAVLVLGQGGPKQHPHSQVHTDRRPVKRRCVRVSIRFEVSPASSSPSSSSSENDPSKAGSHGRAPCQATTSPVSLECY